MQPETDSVVGRRQSGVGPVSVRLPKTDARLPAFRRLFRAIRVVFGMPDYDRYVEHRQACHAGEPLLSPSDYYAQHLKRRYESGGPTRCC